MGKCPHCAGMAKALRAAETRNLEHVKREFALECLVKELFDQGVFPPNVMRRIQASKLRLDAGNA